MKAKCIPVPHFRYIKIPAKGPVFCFSVGQSLGGSMSSTSEGVQDGNEDDRPDERP